jgi:hypothetical protein
MRFSQGASYGKYGELYHPEMFSDVRRLLFLKEKILQVLLNL